MGILITRVFKPVLAQSVDVTAESIPPETPTTRVEILLLLAELKLDQLIEQLTYEHIPNNKLL